MADMAGKRNVIRDNLEIYQRQRIPHVQLFLIHIPRIYFPRSLRYLDLPSFLCTICTSSNCRQQQEASSATRLIIPLSSPFPAPTPLALTTLTAEAPAPRTPTTSPPSPLILLLPMFLAANSSQQGTAKCSRARDQCISEQGPCASAQEAARRLAGIVFLLVALMVVVMLVRPRGRSSVVVALGIRIRLQILLRLLRIWVL